MISKEKPTLVLADHPPLQRMVPIIWQFLSGGRSGVVVTDHSMKIFADLFGFEVIPVYRDQNKIETQTDSERYKQKILSVLGGITHSKPDYTHQGKEVTQQVVEALETKNVFIAPSGATNRIAAWKPGISHVLTEASTLFQDFAVSFVYIPDSFKKKFSYIVFDSWTRILDNQAVDWGDDHRANAQSLQTFYESLRATN